MALYDKFNSLMKNVGEKANEAIEITKLNSKISAEHNAAAEDYKKIGEHYYAKYAAGQPVDEDVAELLASIDAHNAAVREAEAQIQTLKEEPTSPEAASAAPSANAAVCPSCGKQNPADTRFCSDCGSKIEAPAERKCPVCGAVVAPGVKFCSGCGTKVEV